MSRRIVPSRLIRALLLAGALIWLSVLWNLPIELADVRPATLLALSAEAVALLALIALVGPLRAGGGGRIARLTIGLATTLVVVLQLAELIIRTSLGRPLNPLLDVHLAPSLVHLLTGTLGGVTGWLALAGLIALPVAIMVISVWLLHRAQRVLRHRGWRAATIAGAVFAGGLLLLQEAAPQRFASWRPVALHGSATVLDEWRRSRAMLADLARFEQAAREDPLRELPPAALFTGLGGADVLLMYVESYGRSALERERYAALLQPRLAAFERHLSERGLLAASGWLTSPTVGGQSWLAHGTIESGLWLADQRHYDLLVRSGRLTLAKAFAAAGYRTVAVKPAIVRPWPEGPRLGFQRIYAAADLGYAGRPYNWVTMPDQYTLAAFERLEPRDPARPLFAELSLISSHAPWTPIPPVLEDWSAIGDGAVFSRWADAGDPPEVVWRDPERVCRQYGLAIDYVLAVLDAYAARLVDERTLLIIVGDHQPAPLITGEGAGRDVPLHVVSGSPRLLEPFYDWGLWPGMLPPPGQAAIGMDRFRDWFVTRFSLPAGSDPQTHARRPG